MGRGEGIESSKACPRTPTLERRLSTSTVRRPVIVAVGLSFILTTSLMYYLMLPPTSPPPTSSLPPPPPLPSHSPYAVIAIDGDANFSDTALLEGWPGDGSSENPFIIDGLEIDLGGAGGHCISISNTRVSFTISNCNITGAWGEHWWWPAFGISLYNVSNGELVNNTCNDNLVGIILEYSHSNTVSNNTCNSNDAGIYLRGSNSNIVYKNMCTSNFNNGVRLFFSDSNTVTDNTSNRNEFGAGIHLLNSHSNTVVNNTCNDNEIGIYLDDLGSNNVENNTCLGNTEHDIYDES